MIKEELNRQFTDWLKTHFGELPDLAEQYACTITAGRNLTAVEAQAATFYALAVLVFKGVSEIIGPLLERS